jgi:hypothetical protein
MLDAMDVAEADTLTFPFAGWVLPGETIISAAVEVEVVSGTDGTPAALLAGAAQIVGTNVLQGVVARGAGVTYKLRCTARVSPTKVRVSAALLPVVRL